MLNTLRAYIYTGRHRLDKKDTINADFAASFLDRSLGLRRHDDGSVLCPASDR